ncbi:MAG: DUF4386 domain-containing protein [Spirochaetes bacterium]|nr:DUF4386 domain-containing protein [Spirochaetota bacterium]
MEGLNRISRIAGIGYLVIFITGIFANFFVLEGLIVQNDAAATAHAIAANEMLFRAGIVCFVIMVVMDVLLSWALYVILSPVHKNISLLSGWLRLVNSTIFGIALFNLVSVLQVLGNAEYLRVLDAAQIHAQVMLHLGSFNSTWLVGLVFFGFHLLLLGYLIVKSGYIPRILGVLVIAASAGYLIDSFANFLLPRYSDYKSIFTLIVVIPGVVGEMSLTLWLLFRGVRVNQE